MNRRFSEQNAQINKSFWINSSQGDVNEMKTTMIVDLNTDGMTTIKI